MYTASKVTIANVAMTAHTSEYSYTFPPNTLGFILKLRDQGALLYYAFITGKTPSNGDSSAYATAPQNYLEMKDNVAWSGRTIFIGSDTDTMVAEIISFQL